MVYINNRVHDNPDELPKDNLEGSLDAVYNDYTHTDIPPKITGDGKIRIHLSTLSRS